ncbi:MAG: aminotransferase class III-fold pyridoxal phosphate-dependent enzyme [Actinomycetia bacterium]|nr:aminotransferase class III-fold pyridoxal phosphate-dependent enzyme [Actinomycetes bacterium]MCP3913457.1 aminotransferase class III-fold pyridoxal phosphate-dependent enzyme [Actinomycetes bacterium]MCP4086042.1 aminotransferase class III-fold pyridoxal phosphate-dependent enzyme [Actinomycetes bacterium]
MTDTNASLWERSQQVLVGGVNSPVRAFLSVGGSPFVVEKAAGSRIFDVEGNEYIDYVQSYGASILGHADPKVIEVVREAALAGTTYGAPTRGEVELAEAIVARIPGVEMVRMASSGTEATMAAIRLARGHTGRNKVIKFAGNYHGHSDSLLAAGGSGVANQGLTGSAGVTPGSVADTVVAPYNVIPVLDVDTAVVVVEPVAANMGLVEPEPGFLQGLRDSCDDAGALLMFDEVITGFRLAHGGAVEWSGVTPDIWCFGKVIGGGLPVGAFGGPRDIMATVAPLGPVYHGGTLSGNPLATAAGLEVLAQLTPEAHDRLNGIAEGLGAGLLEAVSGAGVAVSVPRVGPLLGIFFTDETIRDYDDAKVAADNGRYATFFHSMLDQGIALAPGPYEALFPSLAHSEADIARTVEAAATAAERVAAAHG